MTEMVDLPAFYRGAVNLWVEDALTRDYLREVWQSDPIVVFYVGGGSDGIRAVLREAETMGLRNVSAYVDRDFRNSNYADWNDAGKKSKRFVTSVHEVENFLLDENAISACGLNTQDRKPDEILRRLRQRASELTWWMACRSVIAQIREAIIDGFPEHPTCPDITNQSSAENFILRSRWLSSLPGRVEAFSENNVKARLVDAHTTAVRQCDNGSWKSEFSGKELFRHIRGWVYKSPQSGTSSATLDADLAKSIGQWQLNNGCVPKELTELLAVLKSR